VADVTELKDVVFNVAFVVDGKT